MSTGTVKTDPVPGVHVANTKKKDILIPVWLTNFLHSGFCVANELQSCKPDTRIKNMGGYPGINLIFLVTCNLNPDWEQLPYKPKS